ncbi:MAG: hypothetical protein CBB67_009140 [Alteromonadaceae bacterium TMED7]|uniref:hypothetical protein n=1 Tax=Alteromonas sp. TaxID=232 RepID=UPI000C668FBA|nr:hypothetical protein [Alteromonas sp.]MAI36770.1 hypothetical protein [Alteromonas sp.]RPH19430.1 MAG: hypothetical protein CBB67_009140 [Alteromonadaceae bacterium TMED7]|tara:strand:+ start:660 stop:1049 length:390 start_codon:yes stop_codon:yes gene_type:complete
MTIETMGAGLTLINDIRNDAQTLTAPQVPMLLIRMSHNGPASLTAFFLNFTPLINSPINAQNGVIAAPISQPLSVGDRLRFSVFAGFNIPRLAAVLVNSNGIKYLSHKSDLSEGSSWNSSVKLTSIHLG